jgi:GT2 family glycosyltransferase
MTSTTRHTVAQANPGTDSINPATISLSIVIVTWNNTQIIRECLRSLASLDTNPAAEIIVVDNASSDGTPDLIQNEFPHVSLIRNQRNLGFAAGSNLGIRLSSGEYVCLINSDVVVPEDCVEKLLRYMGEHQDIALVGPKMILPNGSVGRSCLHFPTVANWTWRALALDAIFKRSRLFGAYLMTYFQYDRIADVDVVTGWFWVIRRKAMDQVGLLDENFFMYAEDMDWCKRVKNAGWRVVFYPEAAAIHHCGASSAVAPSRFYIEGIRARLQYCRCHHNWLVVTGFWLVSWFHEAIRILGYGALCVLRQGQTDATFKLKRSWGCLLWLMRLRTPEGKTA